MKNHGFPEPITNLIHLLSQLPGIGEKNATRLSIQILKNSTDYAQNLSRAISDIKTKVKSCEQCFSLCTSTICDICSDNSRDHKVICVVEDPIDLIAIEKTNEFNGRFHVLHGVISPLDGIGPEDLKIQELIDRINSSETQEVIIATNPTVEGEATALYLSRLINPLGVKLTRIAQGIPMGGDIEYIDELTLGKALSERKPI